MSISSSRQPALVETGMRVGGGESDGGRNGGRKRPLHAGAYDSLGPPRARWKRSHSAREDSDGAQDRRAQAQDYQRDGQDRRRERHKDRDFNDRWSEPADRIQRPPSRDCQGGELSPVEKRPSVERGGYRDEKERDRSESRERDDRRRYHSEREDSRRHRGHYRSGDEPRNSYRRDSSLERRRSRERGSRSSSSHRSAYSSRDRSRSSSVSMPRRRSGSSSREERFSLSSDKMGNRGRRMSGHPLFTPANQLQKQTLSQQENCTSTTSSTDQKPKSSPPFKKRFVPNLPKVQAPLVSGDKRVDGQWLEELAHGKSTMGNSHDGNTRDTGAVGTGPCGSNCSVDGVQQVNDAAVGERQPPQVGKVQVEKGEEKSAAKSKGEGINLSPQGNVDDYSKVNKNGDTKSEELKKEESESSKVNDVALAPLTKEVSKGEIPATPDLMEVSSEECQGEVVSSKTSATVVAAAPGMTASTMVVSESPHSLNHVDEETAPAPVSARETKVEQKDTATDTALASSNDQNRLQPEEIKVDGPAKNQTSVELERKSIVVNDVDSSDDDTSSSEDEMEIMCWAEKMFGVTPPKLFEFRNGGLAVKASDSSSDEESDSSGGILDSSIWSDSSLSDGDFATEKRVPPRFKRQRKTGTSGRRRKQTKTGVKQRKTGKGTKTKKGTVIARKKLHDAKLREAAELEKARIAAENAKRVKEEAKPPTPAELKAIFAKDEGIVIPSHEWVRRSVRQPSKSVLNAPKTRSLLEKLLVNDGDMVVLKMKKYLSDPDTPPVVIDAALDALEENTNCEALYIQNFNIGMRDEQVLHLLRILQLPTCKIWCLNIGETYNVKPKTWTAFANGLKKTKVTHMYASEHTISASQKEQIRETIRKNRQKHDRHKNPNNLDVIIQCTHCWWNPVNTKALRPYLAKRGYEYILYDKEKQGLLGSSSAAPTGNCDSKREF